MSSLYLAHFGLNKPPFQITPDLDFFFAGGHRGDILSVLLHVAAHEEGIITLVAEVGSGKTLLARLMISRLDPNISTVYLANPSFSRDEILGAIARDLGLTDLPTATEARLAALQQELLRRHSLGQRVLLVIDEAHAMPPESLEEVRLLSNLETGQHKLVNIMLFGQPELDELLKDRRLRQVSDRIVHRFKLMPLPPLDTSAYVDHRLRAAGWKGGALFSPSAMATLIKASGGRARRINLLADKALLATYALNLLVVQQQQVQDAIGELHENFSSPAAAPRPAWIPWAALSVGLALCMTAASVWLIDRNRESGVKQVKAEQEKAVAVQASPAVPAVSAPPVSGAASSPTPMPTQALAAASAPASAPESPAALPAASAAPAPTPIPVAPAPPASGTATSAAPEPAPVDAAWLPYLQRTTELFRQPDLGGFTLQIATLSRDANASQYVNFVRHHIDSAVVFAQLTNYNRRNFVSIFVGRYATIEEAYAALAVLPEPLKVNKPMVRTWVKIRQDQPS